MAGMNGDEVTPEERLLAEQTVLRGQNKTLTDLDGRSRKALNLGVLLGALNFRELNKAGHAAADGTVLNVCERLAVEQGRALTRRMLEASLHEQAEAVEKSSLSASAPNKGHRPGRAPAE